MLQTPFVNCASSACSSRFNYKPFYSQNMSSHNADDHFRFALDDIAARQQSGDTTSVETGSSVADLESTLDSTVEGTSTIFETLGGSSVMLDLYDVFANPSAFPFPPEVDRSNVCVLPMDVDQIPCNITPCNTPCNAGEQFTLSLSNTMALHSQGQGQDLPTSSGTCSTSSVGLERHMTASDIAAGRNVYNVEPEVHSCVTSRSAHRATSSAMTSSDNGILNSDDIHRYRYE